MPYHLAPFGLFRTVLTLLAFTMITHSIGQPYPTVTCSGNRVQGLQYIATPPAGVTSHQQASFPLTLAPPAGYAFLGYTWNGLDVTGTTGSLSVTAHAYAPMATTVAVNYKMRNLSTGAVSTGYVGIKLAAIGGPLSPSIVEGDGQSLVPYRDEGDPTKPCYIQFFGYTFSDEASKPDSLLQTPQIGKMEVALTQPIGTTYSWAISGNASILGTPVSEESDSINLTASGSSSTGGIRVVCTFHYLDPTDPTLTGSADDDSDSTPPPGQINTNSLYYRFTAHKPQSTFSYKTSTATVTTSPYSCTVIDYLRLEDHLGQGMPGVKVQERYPNFLAELREHDSGANLNTLITNGNDECWMTGTTEDPIEGAFGESLLVWVENGDNLSLTLPWSTSTIDQWSYSAHPSEPWITLTQEYWAGTTNTNPTAAGVKVGTWHIKMWTDRIEHNN